MKLGLDLQSTKLATSQYITQSEEIQNQLSQINKDLDAKQSAIKSIESFTDRYIPVRILYIMREAFKAVNSKQQM